MTNVGTGLAPTSDGIADAAPCPDVDLGWALDTLKRGHLNAASGVVAPVPGGLRGYLVLVTAGRGEPKSQLALAQHLGVDRTVMTYLLDDLEQAGLVERRPDPADRRARRVVMTEAGRTLLTELQQRLRCAEEQFLAPLGERDASTLRTLVQRLARAIGPADPCTMVETIMKSVPAVSARRRR